MEIMKKTRKIIKPNKGATTLVSTIPSEIVDVLGLKKGDDFDWILEIEDNNLKVRVEKANTDDSD